MQNLFECRVKYEKIDEQSGWKKKVTETYLVDAVSHGEAEACVYKVMEALIRGEFIVTGVKKANYTEVILVNGGDRYYRSKIGFVTLDEGTGKEKIASNQVLVTANNVREAYDNIQEYFADMLCDYNICSVAESPVLDFFQYDLSEGVTKMAIADNKSKAFKD